MFAPTAGTNSMSPSDEEQPVAGRLLASELNGPDIARSLVLSLNTVLAQDIGNPCLGTLETVCRDIGNPECW
jgi:hypothetical protein